MNELTHVMLIVSINLWHTADCTEVRGGLHIIHTVHVAVWTVRTCESVYPSYQ